MEPLGHSAGVYETAKERLELKFDGKWRQIALHLEELENFKPLRPGNGRDLETLADLLDITIVNLREAGRQDELGSGSLYLSLCKKLTETMLAHYPRWIHENGRWQSVQTLREFIIQEAEFQTVASETIHGLRIQKEDIRKTVELPSSVTRRNLQHLREELDFDCVKFADVIMGFGTATSSRL